MTPCLVAVALALLPLPQEALVPTDRRRITPEVEVVREASPSVVYIAVQRPVFKGFANGRLIPSHEVVSGSGAVVEKSGYVITNFHLVGHNFHKITVEFDPELDSRIYVAELVSAAPSEDLALLKIQGERDFPVLRRGTSSDLMIGERVIAIGNPLRQRLSVSSGIISGLHRNVTFNQKMQFTDLIQTDAAINRGNSGGPLLNILGELVGINTAVNEDAQNMGFAIPVDRVEEVLNDILLVPSAARAWLGMELDEEHGFSVCELVPDGPAAEAGVAFGDRLIEIDGLPLSGSEGYRVKLLGLAPLRPAHFVFLRDAVPAGSGEAERVEVTLVGWNKVDGVLHQHLGLHVAQTVVGFAPRVRVESVAPGGPAAGLGLAPGDVIDSLRIAGGGGTWIVNSPENFASMVAGLAPGVELTLDVLRDTNESGLFEVDEIHRGSLTLR